SEPTFQDPAPPRLSPSPSRGERRRLRWLCSSSPSPLRGGIKGGGRHAHRTMASEHFLSMVAVDPDRNHRTHRVIPAKAGIHPDLSQPVAGVGTSQDGSRPRRDDTVDVEASEMNLPHKGVAGTPDIRPLTHPPGQSSPTTPSGWQKPLPPANPRQP